MADERTLQKGERQYACRTKSKKLVTRPSIKVLKELILQGDRVSLSRGITLAESKLASDQELAEQLINSLLVHTGRSIRIGVSGSPGVGKSTFIEAFGQLLVGEGHKVAVLAVDPSSQKTKGSILGDKTRMDQLSRTRNAFIRPSPAGATLGGVAEKTREALLLCEAAGFDVIIIETVGVGQSETHVRNMVDFFLLLMQPGAGDELQGIKKGIMEMADAIVVNKADGENLAAASKAVQAYRQAAHLFPPTPSGWTIAVTQCSATALSGLDEVWSIVQQYKKKMEASGHLESLRQQQNLDWMHQKLDALLKEELLGLVKDESATLAQLVGKKELNPVTAARQLFQIYKEKKGR